MKGSRNADCFLLGLHDQTMNALVLHGIGDLRHEQKPTPAPQAGEARVRISYCGVCGSDIPRCFAKGTYHFPTIPGHEFAGTIDALGAGTERFSVGDPVAVFPLLWCGKCKACQRKAYAQCSDYDYLGCRCDGGFADYVIAPVRNLIAVPQGVSLRAAAMAEPAAVARHAVQRAGEIQPGDPIAIFGAGPIGLMVAQWARAEGGEVMLCDIVPEKLEQARTLGFNKVFNSLTGNPVEWIESQTAGEGAAVCIEAAGVPATMIQACKAVARAGCLVLMGNPSADVTLPTSLISQLMRREVSLQGTWNSFYDPEAPSDDWRESLAAMADGRLQADGLVTHDVPLSEGVGALEMMRDQSAFFLKVMLRPDATPGTQET
jgi:L-iditol 2-dehydrogenase